MPGPTAEKPAKKEPILQYGGIQRNWIPRHPDELRRRQAKTGSNLIDPIQ